MKRKQWVPLGLVASSIDVYKRQAAAQRLAEAVINDSHEEMPVSNYRPEYGTYLGYPAIVGRKGILERLDLHLTEEEKEKLLHSAETIKENTRKGLEHA